MDGVTGNMASGRRRTLRGVDTKSDLMGGAEKLGGRIPRGAGLVLEGRSTNCETAGEALILALEAGVGWLAGGS